MHLSIQRSQRWVKASVLRDSGRSFWEAKLCAVESFRRCFTQKQTIPLRISPLRIPVAERTTPFV